MYICMYRRIYYIPCMYILAIFHMTCKWAFFPWTTQTSRINKHLKFDRQLKADLRQSLRKQAFHHKTLFSNAHSLFPNTKSENNPGVTTSLSHGCIFSKRWPSGATAACKRFMDGPMGSPRVWNLSASLNWSRWGSARECSQLLNMLKPISFAQLRLLSAT